MRVEQSDYHGVLADVGLGSLVFLHVLLATLYEHECNYTAELQNSAAITKHICKGTDIQGRTNIQQHKLLQSTCCASNMEIV